MSYHRRDHQIIFFFLLEEDTYTRDNGTHCKNILLVNSA